MANLRGNPAAMEVSAAVREYAAWVPSSYVFEIDATYQESSGKHPHLVPALLLYGDLEAAGGPPVAPSSVIRMVPMDAQPRVGSTGFRGEDCCASWSFARPLGPCQEAAQGSVPVCAWEPVHSSCVGPEVVPVVHEGVEVVGVDGCEPWGQAGLAFAPSEAVVRMRGHCHQHGGGAQRKGEFIGVNKHKNSGRYEAHIWVPEYGKQVYLGGFKNAAGAAAAHDVVALKARDASYPTNFPRQQYAHCMKWVESTKLPEIIASIKRQSKSFTRGHSKFRGVSLNARGRWESRASCGKSRHIFLGGYKEEEIAARHYDRAMVRLKGKSAATNFPLDDYQQELKEREEFEKAMEKETTFHSKIYRAWVKGGRAGKKLKHRA